jgi:nicotinate-nucleotide adenylyltransferase
MRTAIIGGTFDPVHNGHLHLLHGVLAYTAYQRVIFIPVSMPPHKAYTKRVSDQDRLAMLELALQSYRNFYPYDREVEVVVDDCEIRRGGVSYMYDTVKDIVKRYSLQGRPAIVIGDDLLEGLTRWHRYAELCEIVDFLVFRRLESSVDRRLPEGAQGALIDNPVLVDSSTMIRELLEKGGTDEMLASLIPRSVVQYIQAYGLYTN